MDKKQLTQALSNSTGLDFKKSSQIIDAFGDAVLESLKAGEKVTVPNLGTFKLTYRKSYMGKNPATGQPIQIPELTTARFSPSKSLKRALR